MCDRKCGDCRRCDNAHAQTVIDEKDAEIRGLREGLGGLVSGLKLTGEPDAGRRWSFGYWEGVDPGLALVGDPRSKALKDTRFHAVIAYDQGEVKRLLDIWGSR